MGKGIALAFKQRFPDMYDDYVRRCQAGEVKLGRPYLYPRLIPPWIINFPTKEHWRSVSRLDAIVEGLTFLTAHYREWGIESLAVPPLGCGQGQLEWSVVGPTLYRYLNRLQVPVELYAPYGTPHEELQPSFLQANSAEGVKDMWSEPGRHMKPGWVALVEILRRVESEPHHWPMGRISFQKIAYFATQEGIDTGLSFVKSSLGPYAEGVKRLTARLQNHGLVRERQLGRMFEIRVGSTFPDARKAYADELAEWEPAITRVVDLFLRLNTHKAELAASVHFAATHLAQKKSGNPSEVDVLGAVKDWKIRHRPAFRDDEIARTVRSLNILGWLEADPTPDLPVEDEALAAS